MTVRKHKSNIISYQLSQRGYQNYDFLVWSLSDSIISGFYIVKHRRKRSKVERHIITQCAALGHPHRIVNTLVNEVRVPDADKTRINAIRVATMQAIRQNPRDVIPMSDPEN